VSRCFGCVLMAAVVQMHGTMQLEACNLARV
jgi:hypothetical protein